MNMSITSILGLANFDIIKDRTVNVAGKISDRLTELKDTAATIIQSEESLLPELNPYQIKREVKPFYNKNLRSSFQPPINSTLKNNTTDINPKSYALMTTLIITTIVTFVIILNKYLLNL
ncbi:mutL [Acrasis kona]|uniref:MutL n=1 Tax=Acrasis kona TaxID=1008807 RepID=A0AAW2YPB8_9EUKA